jgi:hypothetical protein
MQVCKNMSRSNGVNANPFNGNFASEAEGECVERAL